MPSSVWLEETDQNSHQFYMATKMIPKMPIPNGILSASQKYSLCYVHE